MPSKPISRDVDLKMMRVTREIAQSSKDPSTKVGSLAVDQQRRPISWGYNGFPQKIADDDRLDDRDLKYKMVVHAEANVIINAARPLSMATVYVWPFVPCSTCAAMLIQAGVSRVVSLENDTERWQEAFKLTKSLFAEAGVILQLYEKDAIG